MTRRPVVLFVCTANICRSPWAQWYAHGLLSNMDATSAGISAVSGHPMDATMASTLPGAGAKSHRSQRVNNALMADSDLILTMEDSHRRILLDDWPSALRRIFVLGQFARALEHAPSRTGLADLVEWCHSRRGFVLASDNVRDPFGHGHEAAARSADQLGALLDVVCPRLDRAARRDFLLR